MIGTVFRFRSDIVLNFTEVHVKCAEHELLFMIWTILRFSLFVQFVRNISFMFLVTGEITSITFHSISCLYFLLSPEDI
jgi:hypothetical protein